MGNQILHRPFFLSIFHQDPIIRAIAETCDANFSKMQLSFFRMSTTFVICSRDRLLRRRSLHSSSSRLSVDFLNLLYHSKAVEWLWASSLYTFWSICKVSQVILSSLTCSFVVWLSQATTRSRYTVTTNRIHLVSHKQIAPWTCTTLQDNVSSYS